MDVQESKVGARALEPLNLSDALSGKGACVVVIGSNLPRERPEPDASTPFVGVVPPEPQAQAYRAHLHRRKDSLLASEPR